jgi:ABC-type antimicrobial peptide transport system permease subunit
MRNNSRSVKSLSDIEQIDDEIITQSSTYMANLGTWVRNAIIKKFISEKGYYFSQYSDKPIISRVTGRLSRKEPDLVYDTDRYKGEIADPVKKLEELNGDVKLFKIKPISWSKPINIINHNLAEYQLNNYINIYRDVFGTIKNVQKGTQDTWNISLQLIEVPEANRVAWVHDAVQRWSCTNVYRRYAVDGT